MRVLLAQINPTIGDLQGNIDLICKGIADGKEQGAELIVFPEMALVGYPPEDFLLLPQFILDAESALEKIIPLTLGVSVIIGTIRRHSAKGEKSICNSAAILSNGLLLGFQDKMLLPTYDVFDERRFFEPAHETRLWKLGANQVGVTICEDIWGYSDLSHHVSYSRNPVEDLAKLNPEFVVNLSASPFSISHFNSRLSVCAKAAQALKCPLLLCNQVGGNDSLIFDGRSLCVDKNGKLVACAKAFETDNLFVDLSVNHKPLLQKNDPIRDIYQALVLGIRDYFRKSGFTKACLGLSGGVDSALVAYLAVEALGKENVMGVLMPSRYSSADSLKDAQQLVNALQIDSQTISIEGPFQGFLDLMSPSFIDCLPDTTEENMQARLRGMILMSLSNKFGYIVLSTGNKSELAMGYATLYGDMCGGLAVISDLTKQQVYQLSNWINRDKEIIPWNTIKKAPSAELRPNQKDSDSLPDYSIVDNVLQLYIVEHQSPQHIAERFGYPLELVNELVKKIHRNEYKRRQGPLGLRVSDKAFSVGRRFPIVQKYI